MTLGIGQIFSIGIGLLMVGGGIWDLLKVRPRARDADMALLNRWGSLVIVVFGIILLISGLTRAFGITGSV